MWVGVGVAVPMIVGAVILFALGQIYVAPILLSAAGILLGLGAMARHGWFRQPFR